ncbi:MAG: rhomboid family intramembrane serine protease [Longimicrobiales bacterium]
MTPWVQRLLIANVVMFLVTGAMPVVQQLLAFVPTRVLLAPWTPITYMFLHANLTHMLFNMVGLFFFGPRLEERLGSKNFIWFYLLSGLGGAVFSFVFSPFAAVVGASGAVFGVLLGFARYWPREDIYIWGVLPIQARMLAIFLVVSSLYAGFTGARDGVAHFAHLGGLVFGWLFLKGWERRRKGRRIERPNSHYKAPGVQDLDAKERWESIPREGLHEVNLEELDKLIGKMKVGGVKALSGEEKDFLERLANRA